MNRRRVFVTGIGAVTPIGHGAEGLWKGVLAARSAVDRVTRFDPAGFRSQVGAEVRNFDPLETMDAKRARRLDRFSRYSVVAAVMAVRDGGLKPDYLERDRCGVSMGSALGGFGFAEESYDLYLKDGPRAVDPTLALSVYGAASSCNIAIEFGFAGANSANSNSCASGTMAIGEAFDLIRNDDLDVAIAGGAECAITPLTYVAFNVIRAMSSRNDDPATACRPFDRERDGFVMGEGSAVLLLESEEHALRRDARIYCEIRGHSRTCDAHHMTAPLPSADQSTRAMKKAIDDAGMSPDEINAISAHGSSTPLNDKTETLAIKRVFGPRAGEIPVFATKAMHAHALGASGAFESAIVCLAFRHNTLPSTLNLRNPDPECDLDYVAEGPRPWRIDALLKNSFGFGGVNACLVFRRYEG